MEYPTVQISVEYTRAELVDSHSAKIAHALHRDFNSNFDWQLSNYSEENLRYLLDTDYLYLDYDLGGTPAATDYLFTDHSPNRVYYETLSYYGAGQGNRSPQIAMNTLDEEFYGTFRHSGSGSGWDDPNNVVDIDDIQILNDLATYPNNGIMFMRQGCQSGGYLGAAMARSINIPAFVLNAYWGNATHKSLVLPTLDKVYSHCDHYWSTLFSHHWGTEKCQSWSDWQGNIMHLDPSLPGDDRVTADELTSLRDQWQMTDHPESYGNIAMFTGLIGDGWSTMLTDIYNSPDLTAEIKSTLYYDLVELTGEDGGGGP
jgi:hypothetical protein